MNLKVEHRPAAGGPDSWDSGTAVILGHGAGQGMDSPFMAYFRSGIRELGHLSVTFNFDYMESGRKAPDPQPKLQAKFREVIESVRNTYRPDRIVIGGKSMGGRVASYIASETPGVSGLLFLGYPLHPPGKTTQLRDAHLYEAGLPMLFISGTKDTFADREILTRVAATIGRNAALAWIEDGDHSLLVRRSGKTSWPAALDTIRAWISGLP